MTDTNTDNALVAEFSEFYEDYYDNRDTGSELLEWIGDYPDQRTFWIDYDDLYTYNPDLACEDLFANHDKVIASAEQALREYDFPLDMDLSQAKVRVAGYENVLDEYQRDVATVRTADVVNSDTDPVRTITGQVTKVSQVRGTWTRVCFECQRCGTLTYIDTPGSEYHEPHECQGCERQGPFQINPTQSEAKDYQKARLQQPPEKSRGNSDDANLDVVLTDDLTREVNPGDRVTVLSKLRAVVDDDSTDGTFEFDAEARGLDQHETDYEDIEITQEERERIRNAAQQNPYESVFQSVKPSHLGDDLIKQAIALQLFGGYDMELPDGSEIRGNIHMMLIGDPGADKSGFLNYATKLSPRSVSTAGKNASSAGLTCAAVQDDFGDGGWSIEGGALVKAHKGLCAIDEFDKIPDDEQTGVNEALSEGTISPAKAGISNITLPASATVLAAANPKYGRFDQYESIAEQIDLDPTLMSRFDLIFTVSDEPDEAQDEALADHMLTTAKVGQGRVETRSSTSDDETAVDPEWSPEFLRKYIAYARRNCYPVLSDGAMERFKQFYTDLRSGSNGDDDRVAITPRKIHALVRLGIASARVRLSDEITVEDAERVIHLVRSCMEDVGVDPETGEFDADVLETGQSKAQRDRVKELKEMVNELARQNKKGAPIPKIVERRSGTENQVLHRINKLKQKGELYEPKEGYLRAT